MITMFLNLWILCVRRVMTVVISRPRNVLSCVGWDVKPYLYPYHIIGSSRSSLWL